MNPKIILFLFAAIFYCCCSPSVYKPTELDVKNGRQHFSDLSLVQLNKGFSLYKGKCGSCHQLFKPLEITKDRWAKVLPDMKVEAKLSDEEYELICRYVKSKSDFTAKSNL